MVVLGSLTFILSYYLVAAINLGTSADGHAFLHKDRHPDNETHVPAPVAISITISTNGETGLDGNTLKPCKSGSHSQELTGVDRSGYCHWDADDGGFHEVCVEMTDKFLVDSATVDKNDLSKVVQAGDDWCICAWAFASAVSRDPEKAEGLKLKCSSTNSKLRNVYQSHAELEGPAGNGYDSSAALKFINDRCGSP